MKTGDKVLPAVSPLRAPPSPPWELASVAPSPGHGEAPTLSLLRPSVGSPRWLGSASASRMERDVAKKRARGCAGALARRALELERPAGVHLRSAASLLGWGFCGRNGAGEARGFNEGNR